MSRPGMNAYYAVTKNIEGGGQEEFVFDIDESGFIWRSVDGKIGETPFHQLATIPLVAKHVKRRFAGESKDVNMGGGDIPIDLLARMGSTREEFFYEEPLKGTSKVKIMVANGGQEELEVTLVLWGASPHDDPYFVKPEFWPEITPYKVVEYERRKQQAENDAESE